MSKTLQGKYCLGERLVRPSLNQIEGRGETRRVEPKAMDVLVYLAQKAGEVLPKEQIILAVWPDTFITDEVLTSGHPATAQGLPRRSQGVYLHSNHSAGCRKPGV